MKNQKVSLGAHYLAYLMEVALREGCIGQLLEIYDGGNPTVSKDCFAQAWGVGKLLRGYDALRE